MLINFNALDLPFSYQKVAQIELVTSPCGLVESASASVLVSRKFDSRPGLTKTL